MALEYKLVPPRDTYNGRGVDYYRTATYGNCERYSSNGDKSRDKTYEGARAAESRDNRKWEELQAFSKLGHPRSHQILI